MKTRCRPATLDDFEAVQRLCDPERFDEPVLRVRLRREFGVCLESGSSRSVILERSAGAHGWDLAGVLIACFVRPEFSEDARRNERPFLAARTVEWVEAGRSPFPSLEEMAALNAAQGLDLLILEWAIDPKLPLSDFNQAKRETLEGFVRRHGGWQLRWLMAEACYHALHEGLRRVGYREWNAYGSESPSSDEERGQFRPVLFGIDRPLTRETTDATVLSLFDWSPPVCGFTREQAQALDLLAQGMGDHEIEKALGDSPEQARKRWSRIYAKIKSAYPGTMELPRAERRASARAFVQSHLYELRPYGTLRRKGAGRPPAARKSA